VLPVRDASSLVALPLWSQGETLGAVFLAWVGRPRPLDTGTLEFLHDLAQNVALGVENANLVQQLAEMATTDELTGLSNRRRFSDCLRAELARARRTGGSLALVMVDLDDLKKVNDALGHPAGDLALRHVADVLRRGARITDCAARLGGDEFALVLSGSDEEGARGKAERLREEVARHEVPGAGRVTVSCGIAVHPRDGQGEEELVARADLRLYAAKSGGRNRVCG
jgi:diguanylate cyclase (GGDEF)-like protein